MKLTGFDDFQKRLDEIAKNAQELEGQNEVPFSELFTDIFLKKHTDFDSFEAFENAPIFNQYDSFEAIPDLEFDIFIKENSKFNNWEEMYSKASEDYIVKKLGF